MKQLDLLIVNPGNRIKNYQWLASSISAIENPIWAGLLATFIRNRGHSVSVLDANALALTPKQTTERIAAVNPRLVAIAVLGQNPSASTQLMPAVSDICRASKEWAPEVPLILLGDHIAALPDRTLSEEQVDFTCSGDGAHTLSELINALKGRRRPDFSSVPGLCYRDGARIISSSLASLTAEIDHLSQGIAWDLLPMERYRAHNWHCFDRLHERSPYAALYTTLPPNDFRRFSPDTVIREVDLLVQRYGVSNIKFADELFMLDCEHVLGICDQIISRGHRLNIWAYAHVDSIRPEMLSILKSAGINWLAFGFETGVLHSEIKDTIRSVHEAGIHVIGDFVFGLPEDDYSALQARLDLARELECEFVNFSCAMAYPGSPHYNRAVNSGVALPDHWGGYAQYSADSLPLSTKHLSGAEVLAFRDRAFVSFFTDPTYVARVGRIFGRTRCRTFASYALTDWSAPGSIPPKAARPN